MYYEDEKLDAVSGATDSWGKNFTPGKQYKNVKTNEFSQNQEFYGKQFLVKEYTEWISKNPERQDILLKENEFVNQETIQNFYNYDPTTNMAIFLHENYL